MKRDEAIEKLRELMPELQKLGVISLSMFGSVARDEASETSDLDLIAEFAPPVTLRKYFDALNLIESALGLHVDLTEPETLHPMIRQRVLDEALKVA